VKNADMSQLVSNKELNNFKNFMGFKEGCNTLEEFWSGVKYHTIIMKFDADVDGKHIVALFINWLYCRFPFFLHKGNLFLERTPILRVEIGNKSHGFYSKSEYNRWLHENPGFEKYVPRYYKGLGTSNDEDIKDEIKNKRKVTMIFDDKMPENLNVAFDEKQTEARKKLISGWIERYEIEAMDALPISLFLNEEFIQYWKKCLERALPHAIDGLKRSQRQILDTVIKRWKVTDKGFATKNITKKETKKVDNTACIVSVDTDYEHGNTSLEGAIFGMGFDFVGSNNMPFLLRDGQFGSRLKGGKDVPAARYPYTGPEKWLHFAYKKIDMELVPDRIEDNQTVEKVHLLPIIPVHLVNGANGIACGWSTFIPNFHPLDVITWYKIRNRIAQSDEKTTAKLVLVTPRPYWKGFKGTVEIKKIPSNSKQASPPDLKGEVTSHDPEPIVHTTYNGTEIKIAKPAKSDTRSYRLSIVTKGIAVQQGDIVTITELPVGRWTVPYRKFLHELEELGKVKVLYVDPSKKDVHIKVKLLSKEVTLDDLRLTKSYSLTNMVMLLPDKNVHKFGSVEEILEYFFNQRYRFYELRRSLIISKHEEKMEDLRLRILFQQLVDEEKIIVIKREEKDLKEDLAKYNLPEKFIQLTLRNITRTDIAEQRRKLEEMEKELAYHKSRLASHLWLEDLEALEKHVAKEFT
jgi:DNA topoisomerase-2